MKKILYIDMDEVICSFKHRLIELFPFTEHIFNEPESYDNGIIIEDCMMKSPRFFRDLEPIDGAIDSVRRLSEHYEIYFLSTPFWEVPESFMDKRHWLEEHFGELAYKRLILSHRKDLNLGAYLVDDRLANGSENFLGEHIHFDTPEFPNWKVVEEYLMQEEKIHGRKHKRSYYN
jgi:5'(3')-deoxyribonucleotidase